jgi:hypothetical protein
MNPEVKFARIGMFIYGAYRHGGGIADVHNWMADELGIAQPNEGDEAAQTSLQAEYFAKCLSDEQFSESHQRFMNMMKSRAS